MKRERKLLLLSGIFAVCVIGAVGVSRMNFEEKMTGTETTIVDVDSADITYLAWNDNDDQMAFVCEDGEWSYEKDEKMAVDQDLLDTIAEKLSDITSDKMVEEVQNLSVYGLSNPAYNITIKTADDTWEIAVGDETFSDGEVYISNGDGYVYLTDSGLIDDISYSLLDCVQQDEIPQMDSISEVKVINENTEDIVYQEEAGYCYSDAYTYYLKDGDTYRNLDNEKTENLFNVLSDFTWEACVDYYADDSELETYGLKEPDGTVTVTYKPAKNEEDAIGSDEETDEETADEDQKFAYEVGTAEDKYYAKLVDSNIVYAISEEVYLAAVQASYENLKPDEVILLDWSTVDSIEVEIDGDIYTVGVEKSEEDAFKYTFNDEEIEFGDILEQLLGITISEDNDEEDGENVPEEEPSVSDKKSELKFTFHRNLANYATVEVEFYQYDGSYCISALNGENLNYTDRSSVVSLKEAVNSIILDSSAGEEK